jgi:hypothetical protein
MEFDASILRGEALSMIDVTCAEECRSTNAGGEAGGDIEGVDEGEPEPVVDCTEAKDVDSDVNRAARLPGVGVEEGTETWTGADAE